MERRYGSIAHSLPIAFLGSLGADLKNGLAPSGLGRGSLSGVSTPEFQATLRQLFEGSGSLKSARPIDGSVSESSPGMQQDPTQSLAANIAQQIASIAAQKLGDDSGQLQLTLRNLISDAISPPGSGPPGSSPPHGVAALAKRLQQWLNDLAGEAKGTGQQSEFSDQILDALTAKDSPAHQNPTQTTPVTTASIARTLLDAAASLVASGPAQQSSPSVPTASGTPGRSGAPFAFGHPGIVQAMPDPAGKPVISNDLYGTPGLSNSNLGDASGAPGVSSALGSSPSPVSATDLLARIVSRAANFDATLHGVEVRPQGSVSTVSSLATSAARLVSSLANTVASTSSSSSNGGSQSFTGFAGNERQSQSLFASVLDSAFSSSLSNAGSPAAQLASNDATAATQTSVDVNAVVEQMLKGIQLRTVSQGTSEIRLHLHPENLGEVSLKLTVQGSQISANVIAQNAHVRDALMNNQQHLASALAESGLSLSGFSVDVSGGNAGQQQQFQSGARGFGRRFTVHELAANDAATDDTSSQFGPPLIPASSLGLFNSLA